MTYPINCSLQNDGDPTSGDYVNIVRTFLIANRKALADAALLLSGTAACGSLFILIESLNGAVKLSRAQRKLLVKLHRLLTLQDVSELDSVEASRFSKIDPGSPKVLELCQLADTLERLLNQIAFSSTDLLHGTLIANTQSRQTRRRAVSQFQPRERQLNRHFSRIGGAA